MYDQWGLGKNPIRGVFEKIITNIQNVKCSESLYILTSHNVSSDPGQIMAYKPNVHIFCTWPSEFKIFFPKEEWT